MSKGGGRLRLAVVLDSLLEGWTSMDYVGEALVDTLKRERVSDVDVETLRPWTPQFFGRIPGPVQRARRGIDRLVARCVVYPGAIALKRSRFDAFHIVDHSYAHAAHALPRERTGIFCHDLDALRPLLSDRAVGPRHVWLARSVLRALQQVAVVFHSTEQVRQQIIERGLFDERKLVHAPYGVAPEFQPLERIDATSDHALPATRFILHVGSGDPRKRLELLFRAFAAARTQEPDLLLAQLGAQLTPEQQRLLDNLDIRRAVVKLPRLTRESLANLYRRASLVILPSEREGFGLPVIEALACGTAVLASDIPAFREVGGRAAIYCDASDPHDWAAAIVRCLRDEGLGASKDTRLQQARRFSWSRHAGTILGAYQALASR